MQRAPYSVVLTQEEVAAILAVMDGTAGLISKLLYASGLCITEAVRLRVQDIEIVRTKLSPYGDTDTLIFNNAIAKPFC